MISQSVLDDLNRSASPLATVRHEGTVPFGPAMSVERFVLGNGMRVLALVDAAAPVVCLQTWFAVGSRHEKVGKTGIAHLFEHLMFGETEGRPHGAFDRLLECMFERPDLRPTRMLELSALQATLTSAEDRLVLSRMVFAGADLDEPLDVAAVGERDQGHARVVVISKLTDSRGQSYRVREPTEPGEIGKVLRVFLAVGLPLRLSTGQLYYVVLNREDEVVAGICYRQPSPDVATPLKRVIEWFRTVYAKNAKNAAPAT